MESNKKKASKTLLLVCAIAIIGFKDTGVFVSDFTKGKSNFKKGDEVEIVKETGSIYLVENKGISHEVPKSKMIKNTETNHIYKVVNKTDILKDKGGQSLRKLRSGEEVKAISIEGRHGVFRSEDGLKGYIELKDLEEVKEDTYTEGTSRVTKIIKSNGKSFGLKRGSKVKVKDYIDGHYIVVDNKDNEFRVEENDIMLEGKVEQATRAGLSLPRLKDNKASNKAEKLVAAAHRELGKPYVSGDIGRRGYDCSGLTYSLYLNTLNIKLPRDSRGQATAGEYVAKSDLQLGDLVFFRTSGSGIGHVGIYIGNNNMIHASTGQRKMIITDIDTAYFAKRYVTARRILN